MSTLDERNAAWEAEFAKSEARKRWKTESFGPGSLTEIGTFKGQQVRRFWHYGTLADPHAPSRWRIAGYEGGGVACDWLKDAVQAAAEASKRGKARRSSKSGGLPID